MKGLSVMISLLILSTSAYSGDTNSVLRESIRSLKPLKDGEYTMPLAKQLKKDKDAERKLLNFVESYHQKKKAEREAFESLRVQMGEDNQDIDKVNPPEFYEERALKEIKSALDVFNEVKDTEAGLTAVLVVGAIALRSGSVKNMQPIIDAVEKVEVDFHDTWQAKVAPLLKAALISANVSTIPYKDMQKQRLEVGRSQIEYLRKTMPPKDFVMDTDSPEARALLSLFPVRQPLRASFLLAIAYRQYEVESSGDGSFKDTVATCQQIITEYPGTEQAERARKLAEDQIPAIRETMK